MQNKRRQQATSRAYTTGPPRFQYYLYSENKLVTVKVMNMLFA